MVKTSICALVLIVLGLVAMTTSRSLGDKADKAPHKQVSLNPKKGGDTDDEVDPRSWLPGFVQLEDGTFAREVSHDGGYSSLSHDDNNDGTGKLEDLFGLGDLGAGDSLMGGFGSEDSLTDDNGLDDFWMDGTGLDDFWMDGTGLDDFWADGTGSDDFGMNAFNLF